MQKNDLDFGGILVAEMDCDQTSMITIESVEKKTSQAVAKRNNMADKLVDPLVIGQHFSTNWFAAFFSRFPRAK